MNRRQERPSSYLRVKKHLDEIVEQIRSKDVALEEALDLYEEAIRLGNSCADLIEKTDFSYEEIEAFNSSVSEDSESSGDSDTSDVSGDSDSSDVSDVSETSEASDDSDGSGVSDALGVSDNSGASGISGDSESSDNSNVSSDASAKLDESSEQISTPA